MSDKHWTFRSVPLTSKQVSKVYPFFPSDLVLSRGNRHLEDPKLIDDIDSHTIEKVQLT